MNKTLYAILDVLSVFLLLFIASFMGIWAYNHISQNVQSPQIINNQQEYNVNMTAFINKEMMESLNMMYNSFAIEFLVCIDTEKINDTYFIKNMSATKIYSATKDRVEYGTCLTNATLHSHPMGGCYGSPQDFFTFGSNWNYDLSCIMCGENKIECRDRKLNEFKVVVEGGKSIQNRGDIL